jgi:hypothetical protein
MESESGLKPLLGLSLANKAEVNAKDNNGLTPLRLAEQESHKDVAEF